MGREEEEEEEEEVEEEGGMEAIRVLRATCALRADCSISAVVSMATWNLCCLLQACLFRHCVWIFLAATSCLLWDRLNIWDLRL